MDRMRSRMWRSLNSLPFALNRPLPSNLFQRHGSKAQRHFDRSFRTSLRRTRTGNPADDDAAWISVVDRAPVIVKVKQSHGPGLILLALIPLTAFALGTWQVQRLQWKTDLIARYEDQLVREPLPLPPAVDPNAVKEFDFRRVYAKGRFRHDQEMLVGPRMRDGEEGYNVVTPLERADGASKILVSRGWIAKTMKDQKARDSEALPQGDSVVEGLLRENPLKNRFTPDNKPDTNEFFFPDVVQMAALSGSQPVWVEETMDAEELFESLRRFDRGIPMGRPPAVTLSNNHAQYIFTWYALTVATSIMFVMLFRKRPPTGPAGRIRRSSQW